MKRQKTEILPTFKIDADDSDENAVAFEDCQVKIVAVKDIQTAFGQKLVATISKGDERYQVFVNATSTNNLIDAFGDDDKNWVGKLCDLKKEKDTKYKKYMIVFHPVK